MPTLTRAEFLSSYPVYGVLLFFCPRFCSVYLSVFFCLFLFFVLSRPPVLLLLRPCIILDLIRSSICLTPTFVFVFLLSSVGLCLCLLALDDVDCDLTCPYFTYLMDCALCWCFVWPLFLFLSPVRPFFLSLSPPLSPSLSFCLSQPQS